MSPEEVPAPHDDKPVGSVFAANGRFFFLLEDPRDPKPRGPYPSEDDAVTACANQARAIGIADVWELMVDT